jgi:hypothetical protein
MRRAVRKGGPFAFPSPQASRLGGIPSSTTNRTKPEQPSTEDPFPILRFFIFHFSFPQQHLPQALPDNDAIHPRTAPQTSAPSPCQAPTEPQSPPHHWHRSILHSSFSFFIFIFHSFFIHFSFPFPIFPFPIRHHLLTGLLCPKTCSTAHLPHRYHLNLEPQQSLLEEVRYVSPPDSCPRPQDPLHEVLCLSDLRRFDASTTQCPTHRQQTPTEQQSPPHHPPDPFFILHFSFSTCLPAFRFAGRERSQG